MPSLATNGRMPPASTPGGRHWDSTGRVEIAANTTWGQANPITVSTEFFAEMHPSLMKVGTNNVLYSHRLLVSGLGGTVTRISGSRFAIAEVPGAGREANIMSGIDIYLRGTPWFLPVIGIAGVLVFVVLMTAGRSNVVTQWLTAMSFVGFLAATVTPSGSHFPWGSQLDV